MNVSQILKCEAKNIRKIQKFQLSHQWKLIGIGLATLSLISLLILGIFDFGAELTSWILLVKKALLFGLLLTSISRDKIEDELTVSLRMQSYTFAFVIGVVYSMIQPDINYFIESIFSVSNSYEELSSFQVLSFMLMIQLAYFYVLKKAR